MQENQNGFIPAVLPDGGTPENAAPLPAVIGETSPALPENEATTVPAVRGETSPALPENEETTVPAVRGETSPALPENEATTVPAVRGETAPAVNEDPGAAALPGGSLTVPEKDESGEEIPYAEVEGEGGSHRKDTRKKPKEVRYSPVDGMPDETFIPPVKQPEYTETVPAGAPAPVDKMTVWERKLLDLTLRNDLLNLHDKRKFIPLLIPDAEEFENALAAEREFPILPRPASWENCNDRLDFETTYLSAGHPDEIRADFEKGKLRSGFSEKVLSGALRDLYRASKHSLEENGANTLYIALGLLRWFTEDEPAVPRYAPLILIPVEIVRKANAGGYAVRMRDEPMMNVTVLEKIRQDFNVSITGLDPLPPGPDGTVNVKAVFGTVAAALDRPDWGIVEAAYIGSFLFNRFVMWNDLRNRREDIAKSDIVKSLIDGKLHIDASPMDPEGKVDENAVMLPLSADASQIFAILSACEGKTFVLHGPPGTGKSQTITVIIFNLLAKGKTVLFVAEKKAALEVVRKRLAAIGIGAFCLELHSDKAKKRDLAEQLNGAFEIGENGYENDYEEKARAASVLREQLNVYAVRLHEKLPCGSDLFELINDYEAVRNAKDLPIFGAEFVKTLDRQALAGHETLLTSMLFAGRQIGNVTDHPLRRVRATSYSQEIRFGFAPALREYAAALRDAAGITEKVSAFTDGTGTDSYNDMEKTAFAFRELLFWNEVPASWAKAADVTDYLTRIEAMCLLFSEAEELEKKILKHRAEPFLEINGKDAKRLYDTENQKIFQMKEWRVMKRQIESLSLLPDRRLTMEEDLTDLVAYQEKLDAATALFDLSGRDIGFLYKGKDTDWKEISLLASRARESDRVMIELLGTTAIRTKYARAAECLAYADEFTEKFARVKNARQACRDLFALEDSPECAGWMNAEADSCEKMIENAADLGDYIFFNDTVDQVRKAGIGTAADFYTGGADHDEVIPAYRKAMLTRLIMTAIDSDDTLRTFSGASFNEKIARFAKIDEELTKAAREEVFYTLAQKIIRFRRENPDDPEIAVLRKLIRSNGRGMSIRKTVAALPKLLPILCPCMLMSPISAAQYLDPARDRFDAVIFDEASQLPTCKAAGVLARGKNAVIVGDPKQMPPTTFFESENVDEENLDKEDLESILDDCLALNMPETHLRWHYRSRHESLIAFSNSRFYDNRLYTFPSVNDRANKISLVQVNGMFDREKARTNEAEALAVIEEIRFRAADPVLSKQSLGVITFNVGQQHLIEDMLADACRADPLLEEWVCSAEEPVFVKNLENVQGDERDAILFSVGYGPDRDGKIFMNFGPLNREGGWRRLNVAVTRARSEMKVFASLTANDFDLTKTSAEGVAALRDFLAYAEKHILPAQPVSEQDRRRTVNGVAAAIGHALAAKGFASQLSVGSSEFKVDLAVIDPANPDSYLLGVLLDGDPYGNAGTVRDRELSQISVLEGLGWYILRVWSRDWWDNPERETARIVKACETMAAKRIEC